MTSNGFLNANTIYIYIYIYIYILLVLNTNEYFIITKYIKQVNCILNFNIF
jgi:hypothetical protein